MRHEIFHVSTRAHVTRISGGKWMQHFIKKALSTELPMQEWQKLAIERFSLSPLQSLQSLGTQVATHRWFTVCNRNNKNNSKGSNGTHSGINWSNEHAKTPPNPVVAIPTLCAWHVPGSQRWCVDECAAHAWYAAALQRRCNMIATLRRHATWSNRRQPFYLYQCDVCVAQLVNCLCARMCAFVCLYAFWLSTFLWPYVLLLFLIFVRIVTVISIAVQVLLSRTQSICCCRSCYAAQT